MSRDINARAAVLARNEELEKENAALKEQLDETVQAAKQDMGLRMYEEEILSLKNKIKASDKLYESLENDFRRLSYKHTALKAKAKQVSSLGKVIHDITKE